MIILGLGSNLHSSFGDRYNNINLAISYLKSYNIKILKKSSFYETPSYPDGKNPKFINIVIAISSDLTPINLAAKLLFIEEKLGRKRKLKNEPRICDIDIIDFNDREINFKCNNLDYIVPHERLAKRNFVIIPLKEILPNWKHPKTKEHIDILIDKLSEIDKKSILKITKP